MKREWKDAIAKKRTNLKKKDNFGNKPNSKEKITPSKRNNRETRIPP